MSRIPNPAERFFPPSFTVREAFYAGLLELVKVLIIDLPLVLVIAVCLALYQQLGKP